MNPESNLREKDTLIRIHLEIMRMAILNRFNMVKKFKSNQLMCTSMSTLWLKICLLMTKMMKIEHRWIMMMMISLKKTLSRKRLLKSYKSARKMKLILVMLNSLLTIHPSIRILLILQTTLKICLWLSGEDLMRSLLRNQ